MAYPATLPSYTITSGSETANGAGGGTGLSGLLNAFEGDIVALGTKVGTGATVPAANTLLVGTGAGTSAWQGLTSAQLAAILSDETGTGALVFGSSPTIVTPTIASFANANHDHNTSAGGGRLSGYSVQTVVTPLTTAATGTTLIPEDDTIPQNTEGDQYITVTITPRATTNRLYIRAVANISQSNVGANDIIGAIFQDANANAIAGTDVSCAAAGSMVRVIVEHDMVAGTVSATTFKMRIGAVLAATLTLNGFGGARKLGGITISTMSVTEYVA